jgi:hypothetical protein
MHGYTGTELGPHNVSPTVEGAETGPDARDVAPHVVPGTYTLWVGGEQDDSVLGSSPRSSSIPSGTRPGSVATTAPVIFRSTRRTFNVYANQVTRFTVVLEVGGTCTASAAKAPGAPAGTRVLTISSRFKSTMGTVAREGDNSGFKVSFRTDATGGAVLDVPIGPKDPDMVGNAFVVDLDGWATCTADFTYT